jgi:hypothetical protein
MSVWFNLELCLIHTSHHPSAIHWPEVFWDILLLYFHSLTMEDENRLNEAVNVVPWYGKAADGTTF